MECPNCHHWNEAGARFCEECGFDLTSATAAITDGSAKVSVASATSSERSVPEEDDPVSTPDPAPQMLVAPVSVAASSAYGGPHFVLNVTGSVFKLGPLTVIGREDPTMQIDLEGYPDGKYVSHRHAQITDNGGTFYIEDLGSANHTFVNSIQLSAGQSQPLHEGDIVRIGKIELSFHEQ